MWKEELAAHKGCLLWGSRMVVPPPRYRGKLLESLHETHPGIVRMKALARSYVWWPGMDEEIEGWVRKCRACQESRPEPPSAPAQCWETNRKPWSRMHVDFAGPFQGQIFFILVDAYTKWLEVIPVASTSTAAAIRALRRVLSTHGIPDTIVSDNGTAFTSREFQEFLQRYLIRHIRSAPFHPATNSQVERMVHTTKEALGRIVQGDWDHRLAASLFDNRITPNLITGVSPAELLMGRKFITRLDRLHPDRWVAGRVLRFLGSRHNDVTTEEGRILRRHIDQMHRRTLPDEAEAMQDGEEPTATQPRRTAPPTTPTEQVAEPHRNEEDDHMARAPGQLEGASSHRPAVPHTGNPPPRPHQQLGPRQSRWPRQTPRVPPEVDQDAHSSRLLEGLCVLS
ncbi:LOW QUALITY PROTEIN: uncharacterized protein K02A2.6-like [Heteronotia binoei]|uniref:LOW QUALITY PROTEIN: uncharacterized protein K02A2.6-like n=1 Tax=Heteronotia binoei TaxID=13085 RepID=UPI00292DC2A1|nr:LOW QUALITY PROTEIN: uncharacterized protein K02A2.6-like [Heteronotia binoei]